MDALRVLAFFTLIGVSSSQNQTKDCSYLTLLTHLQLTPANDALQIMRPVKNWKNPTTVGLDMLIFGILNVDEKYQTVESHIWIQMSWKNEYLSWNPSDFCGINMLTVPKSRLWLPDIYIQEDVSDTGSIQNSKLLKLLNNGVVIANSRQRLTSTCLLDLNLFPFDAQKCELTFASMNCFENEILLGTQSNESFLYRISDQLMVTQGEWELDNMTIRSESIKEEGVVQARLVYTVLISRKPMLYVINFIVPLFYLLVLDLASFFINQSSGEKLSFKVTILLAISVLLLILQDMLPSTESNMPYIASYCVAVFALVGISVLEAMLVGFLYDLDSYCASKRGCCADTKEEVELEDGCQNEPSGGEEDIQMKEEKSFLPLDGPDVLNMLKGILEEVKAARQQASRQGEEEKKPGGYKKIAEILDHLFFVFYLLTVVVFLTYMCIVWFSKILR
ncbi:5-hydroxytryptamine receptor 3A [Labrus bergylta]|uniref:5-hydroxytryptamine receptor 3A n=1 Tax=Labrus bergylta TaxID=56723 RepID=UPI0033136143